MARHAGRRRPADVTVTLHLRTSYLYSAIRRRPNTLRHICLLSQPPPTVSPNGMQFEIEQHADRSLLT